MQEWIRAYTEWEEWNSDPEPLAKAGLALADHLEEVAEALTAAMEALAIWQERALVAEAQVRSLETTVAELLRVAA